MKQPVRILQVVTIMNLGGLENYLMNLYRNIDKSKIQFDFLTHRQEEGFFDKEILSLGGKIYRLNPIRPQRFFQYQNELKSFFKSHPEYLIIHSHINENTTLVLAAAKKAGINVRIAHSHASATTSRFKFFREILIKRLPKFSTHNIACSPDAGKWLFSKYPFKLMKNGIDTKKFKFSPNRREEIRASLGINDLTVVIGNVARFSPVKNHQFILKVFSSYHKINPKSKLLLIGDGELKDNIEIQIKQLGLNDSVYLMGAVDNPQDYLNAMDLYLFPSLFEGLPLALVEAQCNGLPIIISDGIPKDAAITELVIQKTLEESEKNWVDEIRKIETDYKHYDRLRYMEIINEKGYNIEDNVRELESFYLDLIK